MCGIVACQTTRPALDFLMSGLRRLEYRGYDSAGVAVRTEGGDIVRLRSVGRLDALEAEVADYRGSELAGAGIGHTRWATHGTVSTENSHPHIDCGGQVSVVHNGIIENADELRSQLMLRGHSLRTEVDSEVVAHLVEEALSGGADLADAVDKATSALLGSWALAVVRTGESAVVLTAQRSPLVVATGTNGTYAASDLTALAGWADRFQVVEDGDLVQLNPQSVSWRRANGSPSAPALRPLSMTEEQAELGSAPDFMAKEISQQAQATQSVVARLGDGIADGSLWRDLGLPPLERVRFSACGTSLNAADVLARLLTVHGVPSALAPASELDGLVLEPGSVTVALSQSGETADVLRSLDGLDDKAPVLALTNVGTSTLGRSAQAVVELGVGPEIGVAATKTFSAQVVTGVSVLLSGLVDAGRTSPAQASALVERLQEIPSLIQEADTFARGHCPAVASAVSSASGFLFVARGSAVPYAAEGALKLKELTYRWAECQPAGELKHGPIALIETGTPVVVVDDGHPKLRGNVAEISARCATVLDVGGPGSALPYRSGAPTATPWGPLASVVVMQHLARELAIALGRDVDKPRNLAKSVTVE
jgi:glucosamine--fructose-6-phosphate aminotransferase (isomerizing)